MNQKDDIVIGVTANYGWDPVKCWVNSLDRCGYQGHKAMILVNPKGDLPQILADKGYIVLLWEDNRPQGSYNICVDRFALLWNLLRQLEQKVRYILTTDVRDVVFQKDPSDYMDWTFEEGYYALGQPGIIASGENILYADEPWSQNNMKQAYGEFVLNTLIQNQINCAGVIAGDKKHFTDLCLQITLLTRGLPPHTPGGGGPDQAAYNLTLSQAAWNEVTHFSDSNSDWALQAGTTVAAMEAGSGDIGLRYKQGEVDLAKKFIRPQPIFENGILFNSGKDPYTIVHQYDRVPEWKKAIEEKYAV